VDKIGTRVWVLDTSSIINAYPSDGSVEKFTVPEVVREAKATTTAASMGILIDRGDLKVWGASRQSAKRVEEKLRDIGGELSHADVKLAALAIDLAERGLEPILLTDDYGLQNMARIMDIKFESVATPGIKSIFVWTWRCTACGKTWDEDIGTCQVCGNKLSREISRSPL
jgi:UPF0271 protein